MQDVIHSDMGDRVDDFADRHLMLHQKVVLRGTFFLFCYFAVSQRQVPICSYRTSKARQSGNTCNRKISLHMNLESIIERSMREVNARGVHYASVHFATFYLERKRKSQSPFRNGMNWENSFHSPLRTTGRSGLARRDKRLFNNHLHVSATSGEIQSPHSLFGSSN